MLFRSQHANNVLLYGDAGTGKSTSIQAIAGEYAPRGLRLIELYKRQFHLIPALLTYIKGRNYRFVLFLDDLSFEEDESDYKELKAMLEGALETRSDRVLIFCERIDQTEEAAACLRQSFGQSSCAVYHSHMTKEARARNMELFRTGQVRILVSCRCLDEGVDVPDANVAIVLSSTSVSRQRIQRMGRIIRRAETKDMACLYYIYIRESSENRAYLPDFGRRRCLDLRFYPEEADFSHDKIGRAHV